MNEHPNQSLTFEEEMEKLESIVERLEEGDVTLEEAINLFQEGMKLSKSCHDKLKTIEEKIDQLIDEQGEVEPFMIQEEE